jgi:hypothetical protein
VTPGVFRPPIVTGSAKVGRTLRVAPPEWSSTPQRVSYQWQLCTARGCQPIAGATKLTLKLTVAQAGKSVRLLATAIIEGRKVESFTRKIAVHR